MSAEGTNTVAGVRREPAAELLEAVISGSAEMRAAALLDADGRQIASTDGGDWSGAGAALWGAADELGTEARSPAAQLHVATGVGEVFSARCAEACVIATSERFALASLILSDLRALLRELERSASSGARREP
ncbi:MAG TPA: hypothetical protein VKA36_05880 [Solirubrobacterales bacterium]|nr:hypothetical protein [Solirubrobacterales bacterium]